MKHYNVDIPNSDYSAHFAVLGLRDGASWSEVRSAYRRLVRSFHPDRYERNSASQSAAETRIKSVNHAYRKLNEYYRAHGSAPSATIHQSAPPNSTQATPCNASTPPYDEAVLPRQRPRGTLMAFTIGTTAIIAYLLIDPTPPGNPSAGPHVQREAPGLAINPDKITSIPQTTVARYFAAGATLGEVLAAQGIPSRVDGQVWHYGESAIYFENGVVTRWTEHPRNPLRVKPTSEMPSQFFTYGSSKAEVKAVQGNAWRETKDVWEYGQSRVIFRNNHVLRWEESPYYPLRVHE